MNLVIDIGNTRSKLAVFDNDKVVYSDAAESFPENKIAHLLKRYSISRCILSSVSATSDGIKDFLQKNSQLLVLDSKTPLPVKILYKTPLTLGKDRIAAAAGAFALYPNENTLAIDCGTAMTYEFINEKGEYLGGGISPGVGLRFRALNEYTSHLPLIDAGKIDFITGMSTKESILSGVMNGARLEMEGVIHEYRAQNENLRVLLTGGDAAFFETTLKSKIFAIPNLVLIGLNKILQHNVSSR